MGTPAVAATGYAWRVITDSSTYAGQIAFTSQLPGGDPCNPSGSSRTYARAFSSGRSTVLDTANSPVLFDTSLAGSITNLRFLSVNGTGALVGGTNNGSLGLIKTGGPSAPGIRRLNWRELDSVD